MAEEMNDYDRNAPTPAAEDPAIHGQLATLSPFAPGGFFQDRVMSQVWRPLPPRLRAARERYEEWVQSGRVWLAVGGLAAGSLIPLGIAVGLSMTFWDPIASFGGRVITDVVPSAWAGVTAHAREGFDAAYAGVTAVLPSGAALAVASAAAVLVLTGCAWGLRRSMGGPSAGKVASHATR
jgi:hypothetical protein